MAKQNKVAALLNKYLSEANNCVFFLPDEQQLTGILSPQSSKVFVDRIKNEIFRSREGTTEDFTQGVMCSKTELEERFMKMNLNEDEINAVFKILGEVLADGNIDPQVLNDEVGEELEYIYGKVFQIMFGKN